MQRIPNINLRKKNNRWIYQGFSTKNILFNKSLNDTVNREFNNRIMTNHINELNPCIN